MVIDGRKAGLYEVFRGTHHTVLLFTGLDDDARPAIELCRIAEQLEHAYPRIVKARVVSAERYADHPVALGDPTRSAHRQYGVGAASAFVIRPDKYIGYRGRPVDADRLSADLERRLPNRAASPRQETPTRGSAAC